MKDVYDIRRTQTPCEFEMATETRIFVFQSESDIDTMKWINFLTQHNGVQDFVFEDESEDSFRKLVMKGSVSMIHPLPLPLFQHPSRSSSPVSFSNNFCVDFPLPLFSSDRLSLRDVMTSTQEFLVRPNFVKIVPKPSECAMTLTVEFSEADKGSTRGIKCAYFDRLVGDSAMLFYVELEGQAGPPGVQMVTPGVWLFLRLVVNKGDSLVYLDEKGAVPFIIHDLHCKQCRLSRACDDPSLSFLLFLYFFDPYFR